MPPESACPASGVDHSVGLFPVKKEGCGVGITWRAVVPILNVSSVFFVVVPPTGKCLCVLFSPLDRLQRDAHIPGFLCAM